MTNASATTTAAKPAASRRGSNLGPVEKAAYAAAKREAGKAAARERYVAAAKKEARAKALKAYYGEKAKAAAIAKWRAKKIASRVVSARNGAGTVAEQIAA